MPLPRKKPFVLHPREELTGTTVGRYQVQKRLGAGGMGEVYRAEDPTLKRPVALKRLGARLRGDPHYRRRFLSEAKRASALNCGSIASIYDVIEEGDELFLVMEYVEGATLRRRLREPLPISDFYRIARQCLEALAAAHEKGIIHRDIKPENIMLTPAGEVKVLDFGLACRRMVSDETLDSSQVTSHAAGLAGTPGYIAPEQLLGMEPGPRTDLFSLGVVFFEMLHHRHPFQSRHLVVVPGRILQEEPAPAPSGGVPPALDALVDRMLARDPDARLDSAREALAEVQAIEQDASRPALSSGVTIRLRSRILQVAAAILAFVLAVGVVWKLPQPRAPSPVSAKDQILITEFRNQTGDPVFDLTLRKAVVLALDQSPYLNVVSDRKMAEALKLMGRGPEEKLTPELGTELCQRNGIKMMLVGSLDNIGGDYLLSMQVIDAASGEMLTGVQQTGRQQEVLNIIDQAASRLRERLGESLTSIRKYEKPLPEATTPSLFALRAFALGDQKHSSAYELEAIGLYKRALELDPNFALAWARLAVVYQNLGDTPDAEDAARRAYVLKDRVSERERLYILASSSDLTERRAILELYRNTYPRDYIPYLYLSEIDPPPQAEKDLLQALQLDPSVAVAYGDLADIHVARGAMAEAVRTCREGLQRVAGAPLLAAQCYEFALAAHDPAALQEVTTTLKASAEGRAFLAELERDRAFARGQVRQSRAKNEEMSEILRANHLPSLVLAKMLPYLRLQLAAGYKIPVSEQLQAYPGLAARSLPALLALAEAGEAQPAGQLRSRVLQGNNDPSGRYADALLASKRGQWPRALALLNDTDQVSGDPFLLWYRGSIYLRAGRLAQANADFSRLLAGAQPAAPLYPWAAFAHIGLARCSAKAGNKPEARAGYEKALALWKDADPNIPLLQQAKAEYADLQ